MTYTGDTAIGRFLDLDFIRKSRAVVLECTFFDPEHVSRARAGRHIHVEDLQRVLTAIPDAEIMLMLGIMGEYLWPTLDEARGRARFIVEKRYPHPRRKERYSAGHEPSEAGDRE